MPLIFGTKQTIIMLCLNTRVKLLLCCLVAAVLSGQQVWGATAEPQPVPATAVLMPAPQNTTDSTTVNVATKAQNRRLGWFSIGTAFAGLGSVFVFGLMPFLLLPAAALLGFSVMKRSKKWKKDKESGYRLGLVGVILSAVFLALLVVLAI
ncbi:MAG: hypothetical protein EAY75_03280 [Bacteroidetes bacterium]|nr:MAG: hypothetical protein EAY75_03280 [Bacteroidota bacterium]